MVTSRDNTILNSCRIQVTFESFLWFFLVLKQDKVINIRYNCSARYISIKHVRFDAHIDDKNFWKAKGKIVFPDMGISIIKIRR